jgi:hypothetical protein
LKDLGLEKENLGCFNGKKWVGSGSYISSVNPSSGKVNIKFNLDNCKN